MRAVKILAANKFRNAGQVCVSPTRFLVQEKIYAPFVEKFTAAAKAVKVGDGLDKDTRMGPLANARRIEAMERFVADAVAKGAKLQTGGKRIGNKGFFFEPTVLTEVPLDARIMNEEPFGPMAPISPFKDFDDAMAEANRLPYGLAAYAYTRSAKTARGARQRDRERHGVDQPPRPGAARGAVRRRQGFGLRLRGRLRSDRGLSATPSS